MLPVQLSLAAGTAPFIAARPPDEAGGRQDVRERLASGRGWWWFHWLGDLYGRAVLDLLRYRLAATETTQPGLCIHLPCEPQALPSWTEAQVVRYLEDTTVSSNHCWTWGRSIASCPYTCAAAPSSSSLTSRASLKRSPRCGRRARPTL